MDIMMVNQIEIETEIILVNKTNNEFQCELLRGRDGGGGIVVVGVKLVGLNIDHLVCWINHFDHFVLNIDDNWP